jgi:hypothetical protein
MEETCGGGVRQASIGAELAGSQVLEAIADLPRGQQQRILNVVQELIA